MKKCFFYFSCLIITLGMMCSLGTSLHAEEIDQTADFVAVAKYSDFINPFLDMNLLFTASDGTNHVTLKANAGLFRFQYFGILPLPENLATISRKVGCAGTVIVNQVPYGANDGKLVFTRVAIASGGGDPSHPTNIYIYANIRYKYFKITGHLANPAQFQPEAEQFHDCTSEELGTPTLTLSPGTVDSMRDSPSGGAADLAPGTRLRLDPGSTTGGDGDGVIDGPDGSEGRGVPPTEPPPADRDDHDDTSSDTDTFSHVDVTPHNTNNQGVELPTVKAPLAVAGGACSLSGVTGYAFGDAAYALLALIATIPVLGRRKK